MPRQLRIEYAGAIYHAMNHDDRREPIFQDDFDRKRFIATLSDQLEVHRAQKHGAGRRGNNHGLVVPKCRTRLELPVCAMPEDHWRV